MGTRSAQLLILALLITIPLFLTNLIGCGDEKEQPSQKHADLAKIDESEIPDWLKDDYPCLNREDRVLEIKHKGHRSAKIIQELRVAFHYLKPPVPWGCDYLRVHVAGALAALGDDTGIPMLIEHANREEDAGLDVSGAARGQLVDTSTNLDPSIFLKALENPEHNHRARTTLLMALARTDDPSEEVVAALSKHLRYKVNEQFDSLDSQYAAADVRRTACVTLAEIGDQSAVPALIQTLDDPNGEVRLAATRALAEMHREEALPLLIEGLKHPKYTMGRREAEYLAELGSEKAIPALIEALDNENDYFRRSAATALASIAGRDALPVFIPMLENKDNDIQTRKMAARSIGHIDSRKALPVLERILNDEDEDVELKETVTLALCEIGSRKSVEQIVPLLKHHSLWYRERAIEALGEIGSERSVPALIEVVSNDASEIRFAAIRALGQIGGETAQAFLMKALDEGEAETRVAAIKALAEMNTKEADWPARDPPYDPFHNAAIAGDKLHCAIIGHLYDPFDEVRIAVMDAMGEIGGEGAVRTVALAVDHENPSIRLAAVKALKKIPREKTLFLHLIALKDESVEVRIVAAQALGNLGESEAEPALIKALSDEYYNVQEAAAVSLGQLGTGKAIPHLKKALEGPDHRVRRAAKKSIREIEAWQRGGRSGFRWED
jgi:HEAT repeat protein